MKPQVPKSKVQALHWIRPAITDRIGIKKLTKLQLRRAWAGVAYVFPGLHPDDARFYHNGADEELGWPTTEIAELRWLDALSGWPLALQSLWLWASELHALGELRDEDYYNGSAQMAGLQGRKSKKKQKMDWDLLILSGKEPEHRRQILLELCQSVCHGQSIVLGGERIDYGQLAELFYSCLDRKRKQ